MHVPMYRAYVDIWIYVIVRIFMFLNYLNNSMFFRIHQTLLNAWLYIKAITRKQAVLNMSFIHRLFAYSPSI